MDVKIRGSSRSSSRSSSPKDTGGRKVKQPVTKSYRNRNRSSSPEHRPSKDRSRSRSRSREKQPSPGKTGTGRKRSGSRERSHKRRSRSRNRDKKHRSSREKKLGHDHERRRSRSRERKRSRSREKRRSRSREKRRSHSRDKRHSPKKHGGGRDGRPNFGRDSKQSPGRDKRRSSSHERRSSPHNRRHSPGQERRHSPAREKRSSSRDKRHSPFRENKLSRSPSRDENGRGRSHSRTPEVVQKDKRLKERSRDSPLHHYRKRSRSLSPLRKGDPKKAKDGPFSKAAETVMDRADSEKPSFLPLNLSSGGMPQGQMMTPQLLLQQTMAQVSAQAAGITGVALPKYYNPTAVNPLKYAEQMQKRKMLWQGTKDKAEASSSNIWQKTTFMEDQDGKMTAKFRKLMGMKQENQGEGEEAVEPSPALLKQEALFRDLDQQYEVARISTHTQRGVGLGYSGHPTLIFPK